MRPRNNIKAYFLLALFSFSFSSFAAEGPVLECQIFKGFLNQVKYSIVLLIDKEKGAQFKTPLIDESITFEVIAEADGRTLTVIGETENFKMTRVFENKIKMNIRSYTGHYHLMCEIAQTL